MNNMWNIILGILAVCFIVSIIILIFETRRAPLVDDTEPFLWDEKNK